MAVVNHIIIIQRVPSRAYRLQRRRGHVTPTYPHRDKLAVKWYYIVFFSNFGYDAYR